MTLSRLADRSGRQSKLSLWSFLYAGTYWGDRPEVDEMLEMFETGRYEYAAATLGHAGVPPNTVSLDALRVAPQAPWTAAALLPL